MQKLEVVGVEVRICNAYHVKPPTVCIYVAQPEPTEDDFDYVGEYGQAADSPFYWFAQAFPEPEIEELERSEGLRLVKCEIAFNCGTSSSYDRMYIHADYLQIVLETYGLKGIVGKTTYYSEWHVII